MTTATDTELLDRGRAALRHGDFDRAKESFAAAIVIAESDADRAMASMHLASIAVLQGGTHDLNVFRENLLRRYSAQHAMTAAYYLVISAIDARDRESAERFLPTLLETSVEVGGAVNLIRAYDVAAGVQSVCGKHEAAIQCGLLALHALDDYDGDDRDETRGSILHNLAYNCLAGNRFEEAVGYADESLAIVERSGATSERRQGIVTAALAHLCGGDIDTALALANRAEERVNGTRLERYVHYIRGEVSRRRGMTDDARRHFKKLEPIYPEIPEVSELLLSLNVAQFLLPD